MAFPQKNDSAGAVRRILSSDVTTILRDVLLIESMLARQASVNRTLLQYWNQNRRD